MKAERCVIFNPAAGGDRAGRFRQYLTGLGNCKLKPTTGPGAARFLAAEAVREGIETIIAAGGDGTLNEVLNGIGDVPGGFEKARLAVMPLGTVNVFASETRIPPAPEAAWKVVEQGKERSIDLPEITFQANGEWKSRFFIQMAGAGLDALAVELVDSRLKQRIGRLAYVWAGLKALTRPQGVIQVASQTKSISGELVIICNGKFYGGKFAFCPRAEYADGRLDVCVFPKMSWSRLPMHSFAALTDRLAKQNLTVNFQAETLRLSSDVRVPIQIDGEAVGELPATIQLHPRKLRIVIPSG
jgi:YegS/Rv2252/BmrU family lipid kinase